MSPIIPLTDKQKLWLARLIENKNKKSTLTQSLIKNRIFIAANLIVVACGGLMLTQDGLYKIFGAILLGASIGGLRVFIILAKAAVNVTPLSNEIINLEKANVILKNGYYEKSPEVDVATNTNFNQLLMAPDALAGQVSTSNPPPLPTNVPVKKHTLRNAYVIFAICFAVFLVIQVIVTLATSVSKFSTQLMEMGEVNFKSYTDKFHVTVLEIKSEPNFFEERVRVKCERGMSVSLWVADLKKAGIFKTTGADGEVIYREGHPNKIGVSDVSIHSNDGFSTCDIFFKISTTSNKTTWHSEISSSNGNSGLDTELSNSLIVSDAQKKWTGEYERGSALPLANLGEYKILLSIK